MMEIEVINLDEADGFERGQAVTISGLLALLFMGFGLGRDLGLTLTVLPLIIIYLILSKYIIAGVALGGVKG